MPEVISGFGDFKLIDLEALRLTIVFVVIGAEFPGIFITYHTYIYIYHFHANVSYFIGTQQKATMLEIVNNIGVPTNFSVRF